MFHHSVLQILPPLLALLCVGEDVCGGAVGRALSQLLPIILHQGGPAHQLHGGELFQKVPENEERRPGVRNVFLLLELTDTSAFAPNALPMATAQVSLVFGDFFQLLVCADSVHEVRLLIVVRREDDVQHHALQGLRHKGDFVKLRQRTA